MHETVESTAVVDGGLDRVKIITPDDFEMPPGGLNIRLNDSILGMEARLYDYKRDAMLAFVRANKLNRYITTGGRDAKIGIITVGKSYLDVRQAFDELSIDERCATISACGCFKVACPWPLSQRELKEFAQGLELIIVVEEKRSLLEVQVREELYGTANQPICIGKKDEQGNWLFRSRARSIPMTWRSASASASWRAAQRPDRGRGGAPEEGATRARGDPGRRAAHALLLLRLSAQLIDHSAGWHARLCGHRLPLHGAVDGPLDLRIHPDGRGGAKLGRRGAVLQARPCVPEHRRRHLQPLGYLAIRAAIASGVNITYKICSMTRSQ